MELGLGGRAAIVTGASRGIGRQVAMVLAAEGCRVLACARKAEPLAEVAAEVGAATAVALAVDVTEPGAAADVVAACQRAFGRVDILVNNAGGSQPKPLDELAGDDWQAAMDVNFLAAARLSMACAPVRGAGWGRMVHVASVSGREPDPLFAPYSAAKAALINLSKSLSLALSGDGVSSNCVLPGVTTTELVLANAAATAERTDTSPEEVMLRLLAKQGVAAGRFGRPEEVAAAVVFLASEQASWITGATLEVDGGTLRSV